jgi:hypothetical protein
MIGRKSQKILFKLKLHSEKTFLNLKFQSFLPPLSGFFENISKVHLEIKIIQSTQQKNLDLHLSFRDALESFSPKLLAIYLTKNK